MISFYVLGLLKLIQLAMAHEKEYMDVLTIEGLPTGESVLREVIYDKLLPHHNVHVMFMTKEGDFIFQRRSKTKAYMPGRLVTGGSGHVKTGETLEEASQREITEEAGSKYGELYQNNLGKVKIEILKYEDPEIEGFVKFIGVSELIINDIPEAQDTKDVTGFEKFSKEEVEEMLDVRFEFHPETYFILKEKYKLKI